MEKNFKGKNGTYKITYKILGEGCYGKVYEAFEVDSNIHCAIKLINASLNSLTSKEKLVIERETENLKEISSKNIVSLLDYGEFNENKKFFVFEFCDSDLEKAKKSIDYKKVLKNGIFDEEHVKKMMKFTKELLNGFKAIFNKSLIHRDIKPSNLLLSNGVLKIADFGFSRFIDDMFNKGDFTLLGTPVYASYEILTGEKYSSKCDVYSCGLVLFEMFFGINPYYGDFVGISTRQDLVKRLGEGKLIVPPNNLPLPLLELLKGMIKVKEADRLHWKKIFLIMEEIFGADPEEDIETEEKCIYESIIEIKKAPLLKLINQNLLAKIFPKNRIELLEKRLQINSFYQKLIFSLLENENLFSPLVKDELILSLNSLYLNILEDDMVFVHNVSSQSQSTEKECAVFLEKINKSREDCIKVIKKLKEKVCQEIRKEKKKSLFNRYFELLLSQVNPNVQDFGNYISWIILMNRKSLITKIKSESLKLKEGFLLFYLIHSVNHSQIFTKPNSLQDEFHDPSFFRDSVDELTRADVNNCLEEWLKDI